MPTIVLEDGQPILTIGSPGGIGIVETVPQIIMNVLDHGMDIQDAIDAPRVRGMEGLKLIAESRLAPDTVETLKNMATTSSSSETSRRRSVGHRASRSI
jgi:gamma-glutamyltranspeptidase/glutathione hydrolase